MFSRLILQLVRPSLASVEGSYTVKGDTTAMPDRMRMLSPRACDNFMRCLAPFVVVSDMFRSAESSLAALKEGRKGIQPPSFSRHNYGEAIDLGVGETLRRMKGNSSVKLGLFGLDKLLHVGGKPEEMGLAVRTKRQLDLWMAERGWFCFRGDHKLLLECWHFDFLGASADLAFPYTSKKERSIAWGQVLEVHAHAWTDVTPQEFQALLAQIGFYKGAIDGKIGPQSRAAIGALQRAWKIPDTEKIDARTTQILVYVTCERVIREAPNDWASNLVNGLSVG